RRRGPPIAIDDASQAGARPPWPTLRPGAWATFRRLPDGRGQRRHALAENTGSTSLRRGSTAMLFPQRDESRPLSRFPIAIVLVVAANVVVFLIGLVLRDSFILRYSMKPAVVARVEHLETLFTSMFMHAKIFHIFWNMLYLRA